MATERFKKAIEEIDKYNIPRRAKPQKRTKDLTKFKDLSLPETQYWIGYICADGNIQYDIKGRRYIVSLYSKDQEVIDNFVKYFGDIVSVHTSKKGLIQAYISSKELCEFFINELNITPNKTYTLNPNIEFSSNFILGFFDGDGSIRNSNNITRYECNFTCANKDFLLKLKNILDKENIYSIIYEHTDCKAYKLRIDRKEDSEKLYKFMYKNKVVCLSRKLNNFEALFGNI